MDNKLTNTTQISANSSMDETLIDSEFINNVIIMEKSVNRQKELYFPGDIITFTIVIKNIGINTIDGLFFRDVINEAIKPLSGLNYKITTTSGIITSSASPITISGISILGGGSVTITISGVI